MSGNVLSLLGLALRGGRLAVGEEPVALAARSGQARLILLASDAAGNTRRRAEYLAEESHCLTASLPFGKAELGGALGRSSAAVAALTDLGLAAAVAERLALQDPERYGELASRMDLKRRRAKERKEAPRRDPPEKAAVPKRERPRGENPRRPYNKDRPRSGERRPGGANPRERRSGRPGGPRRSNRPGGGGSARGGKPSGGGRH